MEIIKKLVTIVILLAAGIWYYNHHQPEVDNWLQKNNLPNPTQFISQTDRDEQLKKLQEQVTKKWTSEYVQDQLTEYVIKDGIPLPENWKLETRKIEAKTITVIVPEAPENEDDYIAPRLNKSLVEKLPIIHLCKKVAETDNTTTCVVGQNMETHRVFHVLTFL